MNGSKKMFASALIAFLTLALSFILLSKSVPAFAQDEQGQDETILDETVEASDLDILEPTVLPDNPFYFLKNWQRAIKEAFTFNPIKKAEIRMRHASEKLLEMERLAEKTGNQKLLEKAAENYNKAVDKIKEMADKIQDKADVNEKVGKFLDKFVKQQTLHDKILEKLEEKVPAEVLEKIRQVREQHLERFGEVVQKLENKEKIAERLEKNLGELRGSDFKEFKNAEFLKRLADKSPEEIKEQIREAQENRLNVLKEKLETMPLQVQEKLQNYAEKIAGDAGQKMEILKNVKKRIKEKMEARQGLENAE